MISFDRSIQSGLDQGLVGRRLSKGLQQQINVGFKPVKGFGGLDSEDLKLTVQREAYSFHNTSWNVRSMLLTASKA